MNPKQCSHCHQVKEPSEFYKKGHTQMSSWCKDCVKELSHSQADSGYFRERRARLRIGKVRTKRTLTLLERAAYTAYSNSLRLLIETRSISRATYEEAFNEGRLLRNNGQKCGCHCCTENKPYY